MTCPFLIIILFHDTPGRLTNSLTCWSFCLRTQSNLTWMRGTSSDFMVLPSVGKMIPSEGDKHPGTLCFVIPYFFLGSWGFKMLYWEEKMYIIYIMGNDVVILPKAPTYPFNFQQPLLSGSWRPEPVQVDRQDQEERWLSSSLHPRTARRV